MRAIGPRAEIRPAQIRARRGARRRDTRAGVDATKYIRAVVDFPPTARIDTRLTILDWPLSVDDELQATVSAVTTFELANDVPAVVEDGLTRHLAWRGYLTGGLLTLTSRSAHSFPTAA
ncbi:MAG TPA: hypothetical protein VFZ00_24175 [Solirubrobacter sp.]|nr:hypothetical protein [Solirubrobacter sp.]